MKLNYKLFYLAIILTIFFVPVQKVQAQGSEMIVEWADESGNIIVDALRLAIENDVNRPEDRVYVLRKGGYYWITETITNDGWTLRLIGETPDPSDPVEGNPAVIQVVSREDGSTTGRLITGGGSIIMKNLYFLGSDDAGVQGALYQPIQIDASDSRFEIDNCIFERSNFAIMAWTAKNNDIFLTNNVYRNLIESPGTQIWAGRGLSIWADQDTVIVENNTFFNIGFTAFQFESGTATYLRFNHNTLVNIGRGFNTTPWLNEAYFANNLIINGFWHGEAHNANELDAPNRDARAFNTGLFGFNALPSRYGPEAGRRILFANTAAWIDPAFTTFFANNDMRDQPFIGPVLREDFIDPYDQIVVSDTMWLSERPDFPVYPSEIIEDMIANVTAIRAGESSVPLYFWRLPVDEVTGELIYTAPSWPLPEDFSYTTASLLTAGTDGLPLGDLNWFPTQLAQFEANKAQYVAQIEGMAGARVSFEVATEVQGEAGTLGGTAEVAPFTGTAWYTTAGGCAITWTFDGGTGGTVDMEITANLDNQNIGADLILNGTNLHDAALGWGQFVFWGGDDQPANLWSGKPSGWYTVRYADSDVVEDLTLAAGENTLVLGYSWNPIHVQKIEFFEPGTNNVIATLLPAAAVNVGGAGITNGEGTWVPQEFNSVALGSNGSITWNMDVAESGTYRLNVFYQNIGTPQTAQVSVGGTNVTSLDFEVDPDSAGAVAMSGDMELTQGTASITLTGGSANIDYVQLLTVIVSGLEDDTKLPEGYSLSQNYPNPFNPTTKINFSLGKASNVKLIVYNILGQKVATLVNGFMPSGAHQIHFDAKLLSSGVYFYGLETADFTYYKKMMLLK